MLGGPPRSGSLDQSWARGANSAGRALARTRASDGLPVVTAGQRSYAWTLEEFAELAESALRVGHKVELLRASKPPVDARWLTEEFERFLRLLATRLD